MCSFFFNNTNILNTYFSNTSWFCLDDRSSLDVDTFLADSNALLEITIFCFLKSGLCISAIIVYHVVIVMFIYWLLYFIIQNSKLHIAWKPVFSVSQYWSKFWKSRGKWGKEKVNKFMPWAAHYKPHTVQSHDGKSVQTKTNVGTLHFYTLLLMMLK